jgi:hypothetical protein
MLKPLGYQQLTNITSATALTVPAGARYCTMQAETADVRYRDDGTAPTVAVGGIVRATDTEPFLYKGPPKNLEVIQAAAGAILNVFYYANY